MSNKTLLLYIAFIISVLIISFIVYEKWWKIYVKSNENFVNDSGYFCDKDKCSAYTLSQCLNCANCSYCVKDGFSSQCVAGTPSDVITSGKCDRVYANDPYTRSVLAGDNNYIDALHLPLFA